MPKELTALDALTTELSVPVVDDGENVYPDVVEQAFQDLWNAVAYLRNRGIESIASVPALKALVTHADGHRRYLPGKGVYRYDSASNAAADDDLVLRPNDVAANAPGRWIRDAASTSELAALTARVVTLEAGSGGTPTVSTSIPDAPLARCWGRSNQVLIGNDTADTTSIAGDIQILKNPEPSVAGREYVAIFFGLNGTVKDLRRYGSSPLGPFLAATQNVAVSAATVNQPFATGGTHKLRVLTDTTNTPVKIGGKYHWYTVACSANTFAPNTKRILHLTSDTLEGALTPDATVLFEPAATNVVNAVGVDALRPVYEDGKVYLYVMVLKNAANANGLGAELVTMRSETPAGGFAPVGASLTRNPGWIGSLGPVRRAADGTYWAPLGYSDTAVTQVNEPEPAPAYHMFVTASSLDGAWTVAPNAPIRTLTDLPGNAVESANYWAPDLVWVPNLRTWALVFNTGPAGNEKITYWLAGSYGHVGYGIAGQNSDPVFVQNIPLASDAGTATAGSTAANYVTVPESRVELPSGRYRIDYRGLIGRFLVAPPRLNWRLAVFVDGVLVNPATGRQWSFDRVQTGGIDYDNRPFRVVVDLHLTQRSVVDLRVVCVEGSANVDNKLTHLKYTVTEL